MDIRGDQQVGFAGLGEVINPAHAILWRGTGESAVDLNPAGFASSYAMGTNGRQQVGHATVESGNSMDPALEAHAFIWSGTAESAIDLHSFLDPTKFTRSFAYSIDDFGNAYGTAYDTAGVPHAMMWSAVPEPSGLAVLAIAAAACLSRRRRRAVVA
jgi:hypothetical protein